MASRFALFFVVLAACSSPSLVPPDDQLTPPVGHPPVPTDVPGTMVTSVDSPWSSPAACAAALQASTVRGIAQDGQLRITTWNARWFPLGHAPFDSTATGSPTDLDWMACTIAMMGSDVVVLEEVLASNAAKAALDSLVGKISLLEVAPWAYRVMDCADPDLQHVVVAYRDTGWQDMNVLDATTLQLSGAGDDLCSSSQRPALVTSFDAFGLPLTIAGVHLKSGSDSRSYGLRRDSMTRFTSGLSETGTVVALGDFNSMGCYDCDTKVSATTEIATLGDELASVGLLRAAPDPGCSEYSGHHVGLLDHIAVRGATIPTAQVDGACRMLACGSFSETPAPFLTLSDHCPMSIDLPVP